MQSQVRSQAPFAGRNLMSADSQSAQRAIAAVNENARDIAARADRMRMRIENAYGVTLEPEGPDEAMPAMPAITFALDPRVVAAQARAFMEALADAMIRFLPSLSAAIEAVETRSATWSTPYARQLHDEVARLQSRMFKFHLAAASSAGS